MRRRRDTPPYLIFELKTKKPQGLALQSDAPKGVCREGGQGLGVFLHLIRTASLSDIS